jgi:hypothetical protein
VGYKREEAGRLHADQGVGGSLHDQHGAADPVETGRDVEHAGQDGFLVGRGVGEVQQQLAAVLPGQLPRPAAFHGEEQAPAGPDAVISVATGASKVAMVRPAISAVA